MKLVRKQNIPLIFLVVISLWWSFYYQTNNIFNDFGQAKFEWFYLIDGLIVLPILCFICLKEKKQAILKSIAYSCIIILVGSYIIPEQNKFIWSYLESGRYLAILAFVVLELTTILTVILAIKTSLSNRTDPDEAISEPVKRIFGNGIVANLISFEARVWSYVFFSKRIKSENFGGKHHFSCHLKDGTQSNLLGFIILILFELPIVHLLLHFFYSPLAANVVSALTLAGLVFFFAEYKAIAIRPISVDDKKIVIRYGIWNPMVIPTDKIKSVQVNLTSIARSKYIKRFNLSGNPNVVLHLKDGKFKSIYLGVDNPKRFIASLNQYRKSE